MRKILNGGFFHIDTVL